MSKIDPKKLADELQKAKFQGKSAAEVLKKLQSEADATKKEDAPAVVPTANAGLGEGEAIRQNFLQKAKSFGQAVASKGLNNNKASEETVSLRVLSCHGDATSNLPPCPRRMNSAKYEGSHYCGACGCGDKPLTQLTPHKDGDKMVQYTKLHYPKVTCPLEMPGFTNYKSCIESEKTANDRKQFIEFKEGVDSIKSKSNPS